MAPIVHGLEAEYSTEINFIYLDIDDSRNGRYKQQLGYRYQPHFFLLDGDGAIVQTWIGRIDEDELRAAFNDAASQSQ